VFVSVCVCVLVFVQPSTRTGAWIWVSDGLEITSARLDFQGLGEPHHHNHAPISDFLYLVTTYICTGILAFHKRKGQTSRGTFVF